MSSVLSAHSMLVVENTQINFISNAVVRFHLKTFFIKVTRRPNGSVVILVDKDVKEDCFVSRVSVNFEDELESGTSMSFRVIRVNKGIGEAVRVLTVIF